MEWLPFQNIITHLAKRKLSEELLENAQSTFCQWKVRRKIGSRERRNRERFIKTFIFHLFGKRLENNLFLKKKQPSPVGQWLTEKELRLKVMFRENALSILERWMSEDFGKLFELFPLMTRERPAQGGIPLPGWREKFHRIHIGVNSWNSHLRRSKLRRKTPFALVTWKGQWWSGKV